MSLFELYFCVGVLLVLGKSRETSCVISVRYGLRTIQQVLETMRLVNDTKNVLTKKLTDIREKRAAKRQRAQE